MLTFGNCPHTAGKDDPAVLHAGALHRVRPLPGVPRPRLYPPLPPARPAARNRRAAKTQAAATGVADQVKKQPTNQPALAAIFRAKYLPSVGQFQVSPCCEICWWRAANRETDE